MTRILRLLTILALGAPAANVQAAQPIPPAPNYVVMDSGDPVNGQGFCIDISGNRAIVGAPFNDNGAAFIFDVTTGQLLRRLVPSDPAANSLFGASVAIDGGLAIVAASQRNSAYVFDVNTGQQLRKLTPFSNPNYYVVSVDISDGVAVLGTPYILPSPSLSETTGAAFIYHATNGNLLHRINGPTDIFKREFGRIVKMDGRAVAVSAPSDFQHDDVKLYDVMTGQLKWSYGYTTGSELLSIKDVAIDGGHVVIGETNFFGQDMVQVRVLDQTTSFDQIRINTSNARADRLDLSGNRLVVGAFGSPSPNGGAVVGDVRFFDIATGNSLGTIANPRPTADDNFGLAVALVGNRLLVGEPGEDSFHGVVYSFSIPEPATVILVLAGALAGIPLRLRRAKTRFHTVEPAPCCRR